MNPNLHNITKLLLLDIPEHHLKKYHGAVTALDRCAQTLSPSGASIDLAKTIEAQKQKVQALQLELKQIKTFIDLTQESCYELMNGADARVRPEMKNAVSVLMVAKLGSNGAKLNLLMGNSPELQPGKMRLSPHAHHVLQLVLIGKIRDQCQAVQKQKKSDLMSSQMTILQKMLKLSASIRSCNQVLERREAQVGDKNKKNWENVENRLKFLVLEHNLEYCNLRKTELQICKQMLGPRGFERMQSVLAKVKVEHSDFVKKNSDKRQRLELFEGLGSDFKKVTEKYIDMEKKIMYTKATLNQLDSMCK